MNLQKLFIYSGDDFHGNYEELDNVTLRFREAYKRIKSNNTGTK